MNIPLFVERADEDGAHEHPTLAHFRNAAAATALGRQFIIEPDHIYPKNPQDRITAYNNSPFRTQERKRVKNEKRLFIIINIIVLQHTKKENISKQFCITT